MAAFSLYILNFQQDSTYKDESNHYYQYLVSLQICILAKTKDYTVLLRPTPLRCRRSSRISYWLCFNWWLTSRFLSRKSRLSSSNWARFTFKSSFSYKSTSFSLSKSSNFFCWLEHRSFKLPNAIWCVLIDGALGDHILVETLEV